MIRKMAFGKVDSEKCLEALYVECTSKTVQVFMNRFSEAIRFENRKYGITVQVLKPFFIRTNIIADFNQTTAMNMAPDAAQYARQAISTLGITDHTAGYWAYGLMVRSLWPYIYIKSVYRMHSV